MFLTNILYQSCVSDISILRPSERKSWGEKMPKRKQDLSEKFLNWHKTWLACKAPQPIPTQEKIQPKRMDSSHFSLSSKLCYTAIRQRVAFLQTAALSHPEKCIRETTPRPFMLCVHPFCLSALSEKLLCCCFLIALTLFSTTAYARKYFGSFSDQIWHWESLVPPTY